MRERLVSVAVVAASTLSALLLGELVLAAASVSFPLYYRYDEQLGSALRPHASGRYRREGDGRVVISSQGLRDQERSLEKPPGVFRVAVLGDSLVESLQVDREDNFLARAEEELRRCGALGGRRAELLNFGVSGYGAAQAIVMARTRALAFAPDAVVLLFSSSTDLLDSTLAPGAVPDRPYFLLQDGRLVLDESFRQTAAFRRGTSRPVRLLHAAINHSRVVQVFHEAWVRARAAPSGAAADPALDPQLYAEASGPWLERWRVTEAMLRLLRATVERGGATLLVATSGTPIQVHPDAAARASFAALAHVADLDAVDRRLEAAARRDAYGFLALAPALAAFAAAEHRFVFGFDNAGLGRGHYNHDGHRVVAHQLASRLCRDLGGELSAAPTPHPGATP